MSVGVASRVGIGGELVPGPKGSRFPVRIALSARVGQTVADYATLVSRTTTSVACTALKMGWWKVTGSKILYYPHPRPHPSQDPKRTSRSSQHVTNAANRSITRMTKKFNTRRLHSGSLSVGAGLVDCQGGFLPWGSNFGASSNPSDARRNPKNQKIMRSCWPGGWFSMGFLLLF